MRVITFSRTFPSYHPRKGESTYFIEKIWAGLADGTDRMQGNVDMDFNEYYNGVPKHHTVRNGHRWKRGDFFSPRYWSGKPYASKQNIITEPLQLVNVWDIKIEGYMIFINRELFSSSQYSQEATMLATNDGLLVDDFWNWFPQKPGKIFEGQILCWNEAIEY